MNSGNKFDTFKQSLASMGRNSQVNSIGNAKSSQAIGMNGSQAKSNYLYESNAPNFAQNLHTNNNNSTQSRGTLRSAIKFDYQLGNMKVPASQIAEVINKPSANVFSCMDNPNYQRDF